MIARGTIGGAMDGDVNFKIGILMMSMFFGGFIGSNLAGLLIDRYRKFKIIGIGSISTGKIINTRFFHGMSEFCGLTRAGSESRTVKVSKYLF